MGWQWHQLDHMQITSTSLQTDNHASTSLFNCLQAGCSSWCPANGVKALKARSRVMKAEEGNCTAHIATYKLYWNIINVKYANCCLRCTLVCDYNCDSYWWCIIVLLCDSLWENFTFTWDEEDHSANLSPACSVVRILHISCLCAKCRGCADYIKADYIMLTLLCTMCCLACFAWKITHMQWLPSIGFGRNRLKPTQI